MPLPPQVLLDCFRRHCFEALHPWTYHAELPELLRTPVPHKNYQGHPLSLSVQTIRNDDAVASDFERNMSGMACVISRDQPVLVLISRLRSFPSRMARINAYVFVSTGLKYSPCSAIPFPFTLIRSEQSTSHTLLGTGYVSSSPARPGRTSQNVSAQPRPRLPPATIRTQMLAQC